MPTPSPATHEGRIVAVLAYAGIVAAVMQTLVVPLITELPKLLSTTASNASWVITVTLLTGAVATPVAGKLGDMYGKRRIALVLTVPMILGSAVCALSSSLTPMVVGRGLQGLGIGIVPLGISLLRDVLPPARLHSSIALMSASMGIGGALGLPFAATVAEKADWHVLFWVATGMSALITVAVFLWVPSVRPDTEERARFDFVGALGLGAALVCLLLAVSKGSDWGWASASVVGLLVATVAIVAAWGWFELRQDHPLVDLRVTARPQVLWTNVASFLVGFAMYAQSLVVPQLLELPAATGYGLGQSMIQMGLWMAPAGLVMMAMSPVGAKITGRFGAKVTLSLGALVIAVGYGAAQGLLGSAWGLLVVTLLCGSGVGLAYGAMPALIMAAVPHHETGAANGFNSIMRSVGSSVSAAVMGAVLARLTATTGGYTFPSLGGFRVALVIGAGVALVAAVVAALVPTASRTVDAAAAPEREPAAVA
ncbi:MFS transporter [Xylanimonas sp. McL0601]|uniref:MFS transporter n=1 Tax=Xylanimonas sp. McL0601 TaxID=3414739 RepID=UPI003CEB322B